MDKKVLIEALKEPAREIILAAIPGVLVYLGTLNTTWAVILYLVLRTVEKYLHKADSENPVTNFLRFE